MKKIRVILIALSFVLSGSFVNAQTNNTEGVSIAPTVTPPDPSAMLDVTATDKGVLIPRVTLTMTTSAAPVTAPANSLLVYNTATINDVIPGFYYWDNSGSKWLKMGGKNEEWKVIGSAGTMDNGVAIPNYNANFSQPIGSITDDNGFGTDPMPLSIRKRSDGVVEIKGAFYAPTGSETLSLFSTPSGYSVPANTFVFGAIIELNTKEVGYIHVSDPGGVWYSSLGNQRTYWVDLSFDPAP